LVAHPGTQYSHQLVRQLENFGVLYQFWTGFALPVNKTTSFFLRFLGKNWKRKISNRLLYDVPSFKVKMFPFLEVRTILELRRGNCTEDIFFKRNKTFQESIPDSSLLACDLVIGFDTSSWILIERCKKLNKKFVLDVSIAHPRNKLQVYNRIVRDYPNWKTSVRQKKDEHVQLEHYEMEAADHITVASEFTWRTLTDNGIQKSKVTVNPYGVDVNAFNPVIKENVGHLRFVFVGLVDARKGIPILLDAWRDATSQDETLTLVGPISEEVRNLIAKEHPDVIIAGRIPFTEIVARLPHFDVMIFPSYFEGFGLVILEAMASGLPVITTYATAGPDVITNYCDGVIVPEGNKEELVKAINFFIQTKKDYGRMSQQARLTATKFTWDKYGGNWNKILHDLHADQVKRQ